MVTTTARPTNRRWLVRGQRFVRRVLHGSCGVNSYLWPFVVLSGANLATPTWQGRRDECAFKNFKTLRVESAFHGTGAPLKPTSTSTFNSFLGARACSSSSSTAAGSAMAASDNDENGRTNIRRSTAFTATTTMTTAAVDNQNEVAANRVVPTTPSSSSSSSSYFYGSLMAGILSGAVSGVLVAPLDVLRTQWQVIGSSSSSAEAVVVATAAAAASSATNGHNNGLHHNKKPINLMATIWKREGIPGFFRGLTATLVTVPAFWGVYCKWCMMSLGCDVVSFFYQEYYKETFRPLNCSLTNHYSSLHALSLHQMVSWDITKIYLKFHCTKSLSIGVSGGETIMMA
jgi:hypothetical protein